MHDRSTSIVPATNLRQAKTERDSRSPSMNRDRYATKNINTPPLEHQRQNGDDYEIVRDTIAAASRGSAWRHP